MRYALLPIGLIAGLMVACGGHTTGGTNGMSSPNPPQSAGLVAGIVGGTSDSPQINHQAVGTAGATVTLDGQSATTAMIQPGMMMVGSTTVGGMNMGMGMGSGMMGGSGFTMQAVHLMSSFMGPIQSLDTAASRITVMGQVIQLNALTQLAQENQDGTYTTLTLADFKAGDFVSVYGAFLSDGSYLATRIERRKPGMDTSQNGTMGQISNLDVSAKTFTLGTWTVSYTSATVSGALANGAWAQVRGTVSGSQIAATWINVMGPMGNPGTGMGLRGMVQNLDTTTKTFGLMSLTVSYAQATVVGTLVEGAMVEVQGSLASSSTTTLNATRVEVEVAGMGGGMMGGSGMSNQQAKGAISALDLTAGTLTVSGTTFWMDASTLVMSHDTSMSASQLKIGDWVAVMADTTKKNAAGYAYATRIAEMENGSSGMGMGNLMGPVTSVNASGQTLVMAGYTVSVTSNTTYASQGTTISAATFWSAVKAGAFVEAYGTATGSNFAATRLVLGGMSGMGGGMMGGGM